MIQQHTQTSIYERNIHSFLKCKAKFESLVQMMIYLGYYFNNGCKTSQNYGEAKGFKMTCDTFHFYADGVN